MFYLHFYHYFMGQGPVILKIEYEIIPENSLKLQRFVSQWIMAIGQGEILDRNKATVLKGFFFLKI